jgi:DsrE/DsrF-like family.
VKLGIIIYSNDPESVWNAFRLGNYPIKEGDQVKAFLSGKGVESESIDTEAFNVTEQMRSFVAGGGAIFACGTCLKIRHSAGSETCPMSTLADLYKIVKESDKIVTF